ncbi:MAG: hypothetical protein QM775_10370 [Pirellulales bacterium]
MRYVVKTPCPVETITTIRRVRVRNGWLCRDELGYELIVQNSEFLRLADVDADRPAAA